jgi:hypothetical protein
LLIPDLPTIWRGSSVAWRIPPCRGSLPNQPSTVNATDPDGKPATAFLSVIALARPARH